MLFDQVEDGQLDIDKSLHGLQVTLSNFLEAVRHVLPEIKTFNHLFSGCKQLNLLAFNLVFR